MRLHLCLLMTLCAFLASASQAEKYGRVETDPSKLAIRCNDEELPQGECNEMRVKAIARGCVTLQEHWALDRFNLCPICLWDYPGLRAYKGWCPPGCFAHGTKILVKDLSDGATKWQAVEVVSENTTRYMAWSYDETATLSRPTLSARAIVRAIVGPEKHPMVNIHMPDDTMLSVTTGHAMLLASGKMVKAEQLKEGDTLVKHDGTIVVIPSIERRTTTENVYNFLLDVENPLGHTLIACVVTGDQAWQAGLIPLLETTIVQ